jgi:tyrosine-specific transport protein
MKLVRQTILYCLLLGTTASAFQQQQQRIIPSPLLLPRKEYDSSIRLHAAAASEVAIIPIPTNISSALIVDQDFEAIDQPHQKRVVLTPSSNWSSKECLSVLTTALLVTGNTVGAGALVLPQLAAQPGLAVSGGLFLAAYVVNLLSGLLLAEVAISHHEQQQQSTIYSNNDEDAVAEPAPSSFREFAQVSLNSTTAANVIAGAAIFVNTCALTFSFGRAGVILSDIIDTTTGAAGVTANHNYNYNIDHFQWSIAFGALVLLLETTQSRIRISQISSVFVAALFLSVGGLLIPGLANVQDPIGTLLTPGTSSPDIIHGMLETAPIMLTTLIFQNIVPPVTKILEYDRTKSVVALVLGSFLPLVLYFAWSFVVLGGGVTTSVGTDSPLMTVFSVAATTGSAIGCSMAVSEEVQALLFSSSNKGAENKEDEDSTQLNEGSVIDEHTSPATALSQATSDNEEEGGYALPAVLAAVVVPIACGTLCNEYTDALKLSGGYGIPVLYGAIPVLMAWTQRNKQLQNNKNTNEQKQGTSNHLIPGGSASLVLVGVGFGAFMVNSILADVDRIMIAASMT